MKKILLIALLLFPCFGFSQTTKPIEGFLGIKFGSSKADIVAAMKAKGAIFATNSTDDVLYFNNVSLGSRTTTAFGVRMLNNQAYEAVFMFKAEEGPKTIEYYNSLVNDISEIYGQGKSVRKFRTTFSDGDGYELTAIQTGNADYYTLWTSDNKNRISVEINSKLDVSVFYDDVALKDQATAKQKAKESSDY